VASVPETIDADQRARLLAHVQASDYCRERVERVRAELRSALAGGGGAHRVVDLACELEGLERAQQRMDDWLVGLVEGLIGTPRAIHHDGGVPA
jgi:hypothetical protein